MFRVALVTAVFGLQLFVPVVAGQVAPPVEAAAELDARLDRLHDELLQARERQHVAGLSYAIVKDGLIVRSGAIGYRDVENELPATEDTLYAIGSTTKAFTATLVGMLVDEGKLTWDSPPRTFVPDFHLSDPEADAAVTLRDLLCHRSGLMGTDLLWYGGSTTWDDMAPCVARAKLRKPFRSAWQYQNIGYLVAGRAAAAAAGTDWDELLRTRILAPLGMNGANTSIRDLADHPEAARGYTWDDDESDWKLAPYRSIDGVKPAGAINADVLDMARWIAFQLDGGVTSDGRRLISTEALEETWRAHIGLGAPGQDYALGWMVRAIDGHRVLEHSGGIDGFSAQVSLLPDDGVGMVLLTNAGTSTLPSLVSPMLVRTLYQELPEEGGSREEFAPYVGTYIANFATFEDAKFEVLVQDGKLAVDVPGQMVYTLEPPGDDGRRPFTLTDTIAVEFETDAAGASNVLVMHQNGLRFEIPREGYTPDAEIDLDDARRYVGTYAPPGAAVRFRVLIRNNRLAVDVPNEMTYELHAPDEDGRRQFRATDAVAVSFLADDMAGPARAMVFHQGGRDVEMPRFTDETIPTVEAVMTHFRDARGADAYERIVSLRMTGTVDLVHQGLRGTTAVTMAGYDRLMSEDDFGIFGWTRSALSGGAAWGHSSFVAEVNDLDDRMVYQVRINHPAALLAHWEEQFRACDVLRLEEDEAGRSLVVVEMTPPDLPTMTVWIDTANGEVARMEGTALLSEEVSRRYTMRFSDYREIAGASLPFRLERDDDVYGTVVYQYDAFELDPELLTEPWARPE